MAGNSPGAPFYRAGGTLPPGTPSYVERRADAELYAATLAGEFCWVLTTRQMGKSSLMARTAKRLQARGVRTALVELNSIGTHGGSVTADGWYYAVAFWILRDLSVALDLKTWWRERGDLPPVARFLALFEEAVLRDEEVPVVVFLDEIDATIKLQFSDDFFAAIRSCYNKRATDSRWSRLTFVLLGAATPAELIADKTRTPFNIGRGIGLEDFTLDEARQLAGGLPPGVGERVLERILYWTGGHPYLTQALCQEAAAPEHSAELASGPAFVDARVAAMFFAEGAMRNEPNLDFVRERLTASGPHTRQVLETYRRVRQGEHLTDEPASPVHAALKLSGAVKRTADGRLHVRNRIYEHVFTPDWIADVMPPDRSRRIVAVASAAVVVVAAIGIWNTRSVQQSATIEQFLLQVQAANGDAVVSALTQPNWPVGDDEVREALRQRGRLDDVIEATMALPEPERSVMLGRVVGVARPLLALEPAPYAGLATALWALDYVSAEGAPDGGTVAASSVRTGLVNDFRARLGRSPPSATEDARLNPRVRIPGDTFLMGSLDEHPQHQVTLSAFQIQEHEVTNAEYERFDRTHAPDAPDDHPVVNVTWSEAMVYATWLGGSLPTEAQWEFAARGVEGRTYPWGEEAPTCERAHFVDCPGNTTPVRVGREQGRTPEGVYDLVGHVWEWCQDWYRPYSDQDQVNPRGPPTGSARVLRGGSFFSYPGALRGAYRNGGHPELRLDDFGFRVVWSAGGLE